MFFVDEELQRVLLASPLLPPSVTPAYVLALAITQMLALGEESHAPVSPTRPRLPYRTLESRLTS